MNYAIDEKVFATFQEAMQLCKDMMRKGNIRIVRETNDPITHTYNNGKLRRI